MIRYVLCLAVFAVSLNNVRAISAEERNSIREVVRPHILDCGKQHNIDQDTLKQAKEKGSAEGIDSCFFACVYKKAEVMDAIGNFDPKKALEKSKKHVSGEEDIKAHTEVINECSSVNAAAVSDGDAGCDRAKLLTDCLVKNKAKIYGN